MNQIFYSWLSVAILFFIIEILTPGIFFFSCLGFGALLAMIVSLYTNVVMIQVLVFVLSSVLIIYFLRPVLNKYFISKNVKSNIDSIISKEGIVVEDILGDKVSGLVKVNNELWRAFSVNKEKISKEGLENSSAWIIPENSILLSMYATIGSTAINKIPLATNQAILTIVPKGNLDVLYGAYVLRFNAERLKSYNIATTQKNVNKGIVENFKIPLPPLPEQQRIAYVLSTI
jgi:membrane protein implicated in regulation of membrane protease activity